MPSFLEFPEEANGFMANQLSQVWEVSGRWLLQIERWLGTTIQGGIGEYFSAQKNIYTEVSP